MMKVGALISSLLVCALASLTEVHDAFTNLLNGRDADGCGRITRCEQCLKFENCGSTVCSLNDIGLYAFNKGHNLLTAKEIAQFEKIGAIGPNFLCGVQSKFCMALRSAVTKNWDEIGLGQNYSNVELGKCGMSAAFAKLSAGLISAAVILHASV